MYVDRWYLSCTVLAGSVLYIGITTFRLIIILKFLFARTVNTSVPAVITGTDRSHVPIQISESSAGTLSSKSRLVLKYVPKRLL
jgi:hypothetical protein